MAAKSLGAKVFICNGVLMFVSGIQMFFMPDLYFKKDMSNVKEFKLWNHMIAIQIFSFSFQCFAVAQYPSKSQMMVSFCVWFMWFFFHASNLVFSKQFKILNFDEKTFIMWPILCVIFMAASWNAISKAPNSKPEKLIGEKNPIYLILVLAMLANVATLLAQPRVAIAMYWPGNKAYGVGEEFMMNFLTCIGLFCVGKIPVFAELANHSTKFQDQMIGCEWLCWACYFGYMLTMDVKYQWSLGFNIVKFGAWLGFSLSISIMLLTGNSRKCCGYMYAKKAKKSN